MRVQDPVSYKTSKGILPLFHWGGPVLSFLLLTPVGWMLLPVALFLIAITIALSVTILPTLLAGIAARVLLGAGRLPSLHKLWMVPLVLIVGVGLNVLLWHTVHQALFSAQGLPA